MCRYSLNNFQFFVFNLNYFKLNILKKFVFDFQCKFFFLIKNKVLRKFGIDKILISKQKLFLEYINILSNFK